MNTVTVTIATAVNQLPQGTTPAGIVITIPGLAPQTIAAAPYTAKFSGVPAGTYTATAQAIDTSGNPLGAPVTSTPFVVPDATTNMANTTNTSNTVGVDIPVSINIAVA